MTDAIETDPARAEIEALLPFYANGRLKGRDRSRVEAALAADPDLRERLALVREDMAETTLLNESLGAPSPRALDRLMAAIDAEPARAPSFAGMRAGLLARLGQWLAALPPQRLAYAGVAALALVAVQGAALTGIALRGPQAGGYDTASAPAATTPASHALIAFAPDARAADIAAFLGRHAARIVDGPRAGGLYRIRIGDAPLPPAALDAAIARMRAEAAIVTQAAVAP